MSKKLKVGILYGGKSTEHEVSITSAKNIFIAIDKEKYDVKLIKVDRQGIWSIEEPEALLSTDPNDKSKNENVKTSDILSILNEDLDVAFPIIHGTYGEDGSLQGFLKILNIPCVGPNLLGSAVCMDKEVAKRLLEQAGIKVANYITLHKYSDKEVSFEEIKNKLGLPFFMKPCNSGSSVGVSKINTETEYFKGVKEAFLYDTKILIEEFIDGREIECAILGNTNPQSSVLGEITPTQDFYSYNAKYNDSSSKLQIPAKIGKELTQKMRDLAVKAFQVLCCEGMSRVDFFLVGEDVYINEINTIPGFTGISMYPKLWEYSGLSQTQLIDKLISLAIESFERNANLKFAQD